MHGDPSMLSIQIILDIKATADAKKKKRSDEHGRAQDKFKDQCFLLPLCLWLKEMKNHHWTK